MSVAWYRLLCLLTAVGGASSYESKYDSIGPEAIINNKRLYQKYYECIVKDARCTPDARFIKEIIRDAMPTLCAKCNEKQRYFADTMILFMMDKKPQHMEELEKKYDPKGLFRRDLIKRKRLR